jgi:hypothetical protein
MTRKQSKRTRDQIFLVPEEFKFSTKWVLMELDPDTRTLSISPYPAKNLDGWTTKIESISNDWEKHVFPLTKKERREISAYHAIKGR